MVSAVEQAGDLSRDAHRSGGRAGVGHGGRGARHAGRAVVDSRRRFRPWVPAARNSRIPHAEVLHEAGERHCCLLLGGDRDRLRVLRTKSGSAKADDLGRRCRDSLETASDLRRLSVWRRRIDLRRKKGMIKMRGRRVGMDGSGRVVNLFEGNLATFPETAESPPPLGTYPVVQPPRLHRRRIPPVRGSERWVFWKCTPSDWLACPYAGSMIFFSPSRLRLRLYVEEYTSERNQRTRRRFITQNLSMKSKIIDLPIL